jgi:hypothetical protein
MGGRRRIKRKSRSNNRKRREEKKENRNCTHGWETGSIVEDTITRLLSIRNRPSPFSASGPDKNPRSRKKSR